MWHPSSLRIQPFCTFAALAAVLAVGAVAALTGVTQTKLAPSAASPGLHFGSAVALSGDTAVIGTNKFGDSGAGGQPPANRVYVFSRQDGAWSEEAELTPSSEDEAPYDGAVAIDGDTIVVASSYLNSADVFVRAGGSWSQEATLVPFDPPGVYGFPEVAVSGQTAVVAPVGGGVFVFVRDGGAWTQEARLDLGDNENGTHDVAIEGDTVAVGEVYSETRHVHVFVREAGTWSEQATLTGGFGDPLDGPVALSGDTLLAGGSGSHVFTRSGGVWTERARLSPTAAFTASGTFGAISGDTVVIPELAFHQTDAGYSGSIVVAVYERTGDDWEKEDEIVVGDPSVVPPQTVPIVLSGDTVVVGAVEAGPDGTGAAYAIVLGPASDAAGCGCRAGGASGPAAPLVPAAVLALAIARRRRRNARKAATFTA